MTGKILATAAALASVCPAAVMAVGFSGITDVGTLGGANSYGLDVNNNRRISGNSNVAALEAGATGTTLRAYSYAGGTVTNLGALPNPVDANRFARGYALNDNGVVVGDFSNNTARAFVYNPAVGSMAGLPRLAGGNDNGVAMDINNAGTIVGVSSSGTVSRATQWTSNGTTYVPTDLGSIDGLTTTAARAQAINASGVATGYSKNAAGQPQATLWSKGTATDLGSLGDGTRFSQGNGINASSAVVGYSYTGQSVGQLIGTTSSTDVMRAFVSQNGVMTELPPVNPYTAANTGSTTNYHSVATDINVDGLVVGNSQRTSGLPAVATLWQNGVPIDLNTFLPAGSGWVLTSAEGINDAGDVTGYGTINGVTHAYLLAVPEPASLGLAGVFAAGLLARKRR